MDADRPLDSAPLPSVTDAQAEVIVVIRQQAAADLLGRAPTYQKLGTILGRSKATVYETVQRLHDRGLIVTEAYRNRSATLTESAELIADRFLARAHSRGHCSRCSRDRSAACPVCGLPPARP